MFLRKKTTTAASLSIWRRKFESKFWPSGNKFRFKLNPGGKQSTKFPPDFFLNLQHDAEMAFKITRQ